MSYESDGKDLIKYLDNLGTPETVTELYTKTNQQRKEDGLKASDLKTIVPKSIKDPINNRVIRGNPDKPPKYLTPIEKGKRGNRSSYTKAERKAYALQHGVEVKYVACLMCGRSRPIKSITKSGRRSGAFGEYSNEKNMFIPYTARLLQTRKGGGRQIGFFLKESKNLDELFVEDKPLFDNIENIAKLIIEECDKIKESFDENTNIE